MRFARPPANAFDLPLVEELAACLGEIDADGAGDQPNQPPVRFLTRFTAQTA